MDSDKSLWTLKQPVSIEDYDGGDLVEVDGHILLQSEIKELFQPLDVESLTTQLETIIKKAVINAKKVDMSPLNEANALLGITQIGVAEVLELLGMKGKDND